MSTSETARAIEWQGGIENAWSSIADFVPKLLIFLVVLLIGWLIAKAVSKGLQLLLDKLGFDRLLDKAGINRFTGPSFDPATIIVKLVYYFILLIALQLALSAFGDQNPVSQIVNDIVTWLPKAFVAIVIIIVAAAVANAVKDIMGAALSGLSYGGLLTKIVGIFIIALGVIAALNQVGIGLSVTLPVLIAVLATVGGILVVGVGGGLIGPMRQRWEGWLGQLEEDTRRVRESSGTATGSGHAATDAGYGATGEPYTQVPPASGATPPPPADPGGTTQQF
jgi:hypothetical protein